MRSTLGPPASSFWQFPATSNEKTPGLLFFCFRSESGFGVSSSSSAQPFCSGILKPNAGKDSPALCLGGGADFSLKWVLEILRSPGGYFKPLLGPGGTAVSEGKGVSVPSRSEMDINLQRPCDGRGRWSKATVLFWCGNL